MKFKVGDRVKIATSLCHPKPTGTIREVCDPPPFPFAKPFYRVTWDPVFKVPGDHPYRDKVLAPELNGLERILEDL